ncbi:MAG: hypothetical protein GSR86_05855 [Desulfurococcales archaeon]|nr:hypothetical protein [Desulfurococcales archaeon]
MEELKKEMEEKVRREASQRLQENKNRIRMEKERIMNEVKKNYEKLIDQFEARLR